MKNSRIMKINGANGTVETIYNSIKDIIEIENYPKSHNKFIRQVCDGVLQSHKGFVWAYEDLFKKYVGSLPFRGVDNLFIYDPMDNFIGQYSGLSVIDFNGEVWKPVHYMETSFAISNLGRVKALTGVVSQNQDGTFSGSIENLVSGVFDMEGRYVVELITDTLDCVKYIDSLLRIHFYEQ